MSNIILMFFMIFVFSYTAYLLCTTKAKSYKSLEEIEEDYPNFLF